jgi:DNA-binding winged helix-turn-helix (wHTH) protein
MDGVRTPAHTPRIGDRSATTGAWRRSAFRLFPAQQLLLEDETPVRVGARALEILNVLVERAGELVSKKELMARVWPNIVVEEGNLKVQVAALRRVLGDGQPGRRYLASVIGQGYRFVAPVELSEPQKVPALPNVGVAQAHNLPASQTRTLGAPIRSVRCWINCRGNGSSRLWERAG